jgi:hypothetical protein
MSRFYKTKIGGALRERFDEMMSASHSEMLSLYEELALARAAAGEAIALASVAMSSEKPETRQHGAELVHQAVTRVAELVKAAADVEAKAKDTISVGVLDLIVMQFTRAVYDVLGDQPHGRELAEQITQRVGRNMHDPATGSIDVERVKREATNEATRALSALMDSTVPDAPGDEDEDEDE